MKTWVGFGECKAEATFRRKSSNAREWDSLCQWEGACFRRSDQVNGVAVVHVKGEHELVEFRARHFLALRSQIAPTHLHQVHDLAVGSKDVHRNGRRPCGAELSWELGDIENLKSQGQIMGDIYGV